MIRFIFFALLCAECFAQSPVSPSSTQKWKSLWAIPVAMTNSPILIRKSLKGRSTEAASIAPLNAIIYQPVESSGRYWARTWLSSMSSGGTNTAAARVIRTTYSELFASSAQVPANTGSGQVANRDSGTQAYAPVLVIESTSATNRTEAGGGWTTSSTGGQTPVTRYSATAGASVTYTVTGVTRVHFRAFNNSANGGRISFAVTNSGAEISASQYLVGPEGSTRTASLAYMSSAYSDTRFGHIPVAKGLIPTNTYTITIALSSGTRIYDSGILGYLDASDRDGYSFSATGIHGIWNNYTSFGNNKYQGALFAGSRSVYAVTNATRIDWRYVQRSNGGRAGIKIYNTSGVEMSAYYSPLLATSGNGDRYVDTFNASTSEQVVTLADGMPAATYYLHVWSLPSKSNSFTESAGIYDLGSAWAIYDGGPASYNSTAGGIVGTDTFADTDRQWLGSNSDPLDETGNLVWAGQVRDSGDANLSALPEAGYVTGTHSAESYPTNYTVTVDGVALGWDAAADQTQWIGQKAIIAFTTYIGTQTAPTNYWATAQYRYEIDRLGMLQAVRITTMRDIYRGIWYQGMNIAGNGTCSYSVPNASIVVAPVAGAVYALGTLTNTVNSVTVGASTTLLVCTANGVPSVTSGTLAKISGTGDASLGFTSSSAPVHLGSGFRNCYVEPGRSYVVQYGQTTTPTAMTHRGSAFWSPEGYCVAINHQNPGTIWQDWTSTNSATLFALRARNGKTYCIMNDDQTQTTGTLLASGYSRGWTNRIRFFANPGISTLLGN